MPIHPKHHTDDENDMKWKTKIEKDKVNTRKWVVKNETGNNG